MPGVDGARKEVVPPLRWRLGIRVRLGLGVRRQGLGVSGYWLGFRV